jgi:16S rRNA (guanine966-N2)-methyltransferase
MRITGGQAKGRVLSSPKGLKIRPTSDRIREALFNIIGQDLSGARVIDLFAGTGSLGLEALSRGAECALFIDSSRHALELIKRNTALCGFHDRGIFVRRDLRNGIPSLHPFLGTPVDLVFLDPPYGKGWIPSVLEELAGRPLLAAGARLVAETGKSEELPDSVGGIHMLNTRAHGDTRISIYSYEVDK